MSVTIQKDGQIVSCGGVRTSVVIVMYEIVMKQSLHQVKKTKKALIFCLFFSDIFLSQVDFFHDRTQQSSHSENVYPGLCIQTVQQNQIPLFMGFQLFVGSFFLKPDPKFILIVRSKKMCSIKLDNVTLNTSPLTQRTFLHTVTLHCPQIDSYD